MKFWIIAIGALIIISFGIFTFLNIFYGLISSKSTQELLIVQKTDSFAQVQKTLIIKGYIKHETLFNISSLVQGLLTIQPGGYMLWKNSSPWSLVTHLKNPDFIWITIIPGKRKEEIGEMLAKNLHWSTSALNNWNNMSTDKSGNPIEGQLFPDTYLLPVTDNVNVIFKRIQVNFNEKLALLLPEFQKKNIRWTTALKIVSIIQREAAGKEDMPLIAGIIWNRLLINKPLEIDATVQYARGNTPNGWWAPIKAPDITTIDSLYNTYKHAGLPPTPICSPGINAIEAVLNSTDTQCIFYLHDNNRMIHCAVTYKEHQNNIKKYL